MQVFDLVSSKSRSQHLSLEVRAKVRYTLICKESLLFRILRALMTLVHGIGINYLISHYTSRIVSNLITLLVKQSKNMEKKVNIGRKTVNRFTDSMIAVSFTIDTSVKVQPEKLMRSITEKRLDILKLTRTVVCELLTRSLLALYVQETEITDHSSTL